MAEMVAGWLVSPAVKIVVDKASDRIKWVGDGVPKALERLHKNLVHLQTVARQVERQSFPFPHSRGRADHREWLQQLRDAIFDASDVLDDFDDSVPHPEASVLRVSKRIFGADERVNRLKEVTKKLEEVTASCQMLLAVAAAEVSASVSASASGETSAHGRATGSLRDREQPVFGRDKELREMVSWLVDPASDSKAPIPVAAIMGHGGMGKTTLAQLLLEDHTVASTFDLKIWVQPKATDHELELATQILQSAGIAVPPGTTSFDSLQTTIWKNVSSRKFLLVIDDVWNREGVPESDQRNFWDNVLAPLGNGKKTGSKIIVTSQQPMVTKLFRTSKKIWLDSLPANDIWLLFKRCAFGEDIDKQSTALQHIAREITQKLRGSPMLAKAVGQMLEYSNSVTEWRSVLDMNIFDNSSTLERCYHNLPEHLQPCFAICSLFPKKWRFKRDKLVKIWMALDFIQPTVGKPSEHVGSRYFDELVDRSFFHRQKVGRQRYYYIHDLMHDLAEKVSWFDCARVEGTEKEIPKTIRHLSVSGDAVAQLKNLCELKRLRTLLILKNPSSGLNQLPGDIFTELKGLRMLGLEYSDNVDVAGIGRLRHLRYLALCKSINRLPHVTKLFHLQTLSSPKGSGLEVPEDIVNLKHLRHLDMDTSKIAGIGKLVHLQGSIEFHVKKEKGHTLEDLNGMSNLRKVLHIKNLDAVTSWQEACQAGLNKKENVKEIELEWNSTGKRMPSIDAKVLDGLEPHQHVKKLVIRRYYGSRSPNWLDAGLKVGDFYLKYLYLNNCRKWEVLPPLGQLPSLKILHMKEMCSLKQISCEFYGTKSVAFPSLEELEFDDMPEWVEWIQPEKNIDVLPKLCKLKLLDCPKLIKVPSLPPSVQKIYIKNCSKVTVSSFHDTFNSTSSLIKLSIMNCTELESLPSAFPSSLRVLELIGCKPTLMHQLRLKDGPEWNKVASIHTKHIG